MSKDELRAQIVKLEKTVETLRAKAAAARKDARTAAARNADLEGQLAMPAEPQKPAASVKAPKRLATRPAKPTAAKARTRVDDIGEKVVADSAQAAIDEDHHE